MNRILLPWSSSHSDAMITPSIGPDNPGGPSRSAERSVSRHRFHFMHVLKSVPFLKALLFSCAMLPITSSAVDYTNASGERGWNLYLKSGHTFKEATVGDVLLHDTNKPSPYSFETYPEMTRHYNYEYAGFYTVPTYVTFVITRPDGSEKAFDFIGGIHGYQIGGGLSDHLTQPGAWKVELWYLRLTAKDTYTRDSVKQSFSFNVKPAEGLPIEPTGSEPSRSSVVTKKFTVYAKQDQSNAEHNVGLRPLNYTIKQLTLNISGPASAFDSSNQYYVAGLGYVVRQDSLQSSGGVVSLPFLTQASAQTVSWTLTGQYIEDSSPRQDATVLERGAMNIPASP